MTPKSKQWKWQINEKCHESELFASSMLSVLPALRSETDLQHQKVGNLGLVHAMRLVKQEVGLSWHVQCTYC